MNYPYTCPDCGSFQVDKLMSEATRPEPCPACNKVIEHQDFSCKAVGGYVSTEANWTGGKLVHQLGKGHPDGYVTSKAQMERVYKKHGISLETGHFISKEAQVKATLPRARRTGNTDGTMGGINAPD
jgi:hypothetical protein